MQRGCKDSIYLKEHHGLCNGALMCMSLGVNSLIEFCLCLQWPPPPRSAAQLKAKGRQFTGIKAVEVLLINI